VILGPDGPSLGGFVCPATVVDADLWKLGQLRAGDKVRLVPVPTPRAGIDTTPSTDMGTRTGTGTTDSSDSTDPSTAADLGAGAGSGVGSKATDTGMTTAAGTSPGTGVGGDIGMRVGAGAGALTGSTVLARTEGDAGRPELTFRRSGDRHLLVEVGPAVLDLDLRVRVHQLAEWFAEQRIAGVTDLTPGIRSLQVQVDGHRLTVERAVGLVRAADAELPAVDDAVLPSRVVHLPLSWNDPQVLKAIDIYMRSVRPDAPWCPSNLEFIRRINGLGSIEDVRRIAFEAEYVVYGLGDVYLGAPVATPLDPRHRLVTTKYNPARTWTPENAVGIGGAYLCVYGMEGPGGYQFIGRTTQVWQRWPLEGERPWLLRFFDRIRFHPVSAEELLELRADCAAGMWRPEITDGTLSMAEHHRFLDDIAGEATAARARQRAAFDAERADWEARGELAAADAAEVTLAAAPPPAAEVEVPDGSLTVTAPLAARVWSIPVAEGDAVDADDVVVVLEAMKTETALRAPGPGSVTRLLCEPGELVTPGRILALVQPDEPPTTEPPTTEPTEPTDQPEEPT
jgi:urea carboxylase